MELVQLMHQVRQYAKTCFKEEILVEYVIHAILTKPHEESVPEIIQVFINIHGNNSIIIIIETY